MAPGKHGFDSSPSTGSHGGCVEDTYIQLDSCFIYVSFHLLSQPKNRLHGNFPAEPH